MLDSKTVIAVVKGLVTYIPGYSILSRNKKSRHSATSPEFCYDLWLSILVFLKEKDINPNFYSIGEIGSGSSIGVGICALLTGAERYYCLEKDVEIDIDLNLKLVDELLRIVKSQRSISNQHKQINIITNSKQFPVELIKPNYLDNSILEDIRNDIINNFQSSKRIFIIDDWENKDPIELDFIFSRATMEHVNDPDQVYKSIYRYIKDDSYHMHDIEFHSHGITKSISGHYALPNFLWKIVVGKRKYLLNRWREKDHILSINKNGFQLLASVQNYQRINGVEEHVGGTFLAYKSNECSK